MTSFETQIRVTKKYWINSHNVNKYMVSDNNNVLYNIDISFFKLHFDNIDLWKKIKRNKIYKISGHGLYIPLLGMYPNIIKANEIDILVN